MGGASCALRGVQMYVVSARFTWRVAGRSKFRKCIPPDFRGQEILRNARGSVRRDLDWRSLKPFFWSCRRREFVLDGADDHALDLNFREVHFALPGEDVEILLAVWCRGIMENISLPSPAGRCSGAGGELRRANDPR